MLYDYDEVMAQLVYAGYTIDEAIQALAWVLTHDSVDQEVGSGWSLPTIIR